MNAKERDKKKRQVRREKKMKGIETQRENHSTPSRAIDALTGDEEQNGNRREQKERNRERDPTKLPWTAVSAHNNAKKRDPYQHFLLNIFSIFSGCSSFL